MPRIAAVVDVRSRAFFADLRGALDELGGRGIDPRIVFLEASDEVLVRRFESVRRPHPLQERRPDPRRHRRERELLRDLRGGADLVIDTCDSTCTSCAPKIDRRLRAGDATRRCASRVVSFGYKYGLPVDADLVVDCRFLPNPHWVPELRPHTGRTPGSAPTCSASPGAQEFLDGYTAAAAVVTDGYRTRGQALRDARRRLHRRQAPQRRDRRGARRAGCADAGLRRPGRAPRLGRE